MATAAELAILLSARDQASGVLQKVQGNLKGLHNEAARSGGVFGAMGSAIKGMGTIMAGVLGAQVIQGAIRGLQGLAAEGFNAVAAYEKQTLSMQSMIAMELKQASAVERVIGTSVVRRGLTEKETASLEKLRAKQAEYNSQLAIANQRLTERTGKEKTSAIMSQDAAYQKLLGNLQANEQAIAALEGKSGQLVTTQQILAEETLSLADAMKQAGPMARELNDWIEQLAIKSPYGMEEVAGSLALLKRYGFPIAEAKDMTQSMLDFAAATGLSNNKLQLISLAMGQIRGRGRLQQQEVNQLTEAGVGLWDILTRKMGKSQAQLTSMMEKGLLPAKEVIAAIVDYWNQWAGASEEASKTLGGMAESLKDIRSISLRRLETGFFKAFQPYIERLVDYMADPATQAKIEAFGDSIGKSVSDFLASAEKALPKFKGIVKGFATTWENMLRGVRVSWQPLADALEALGVSPELAAKAAGVAASITGWIQGALDNIRIAWTGGGILGVAAMIGDEIAKIDWAGMFAGVGSKISDAWNGAWSEGAGIGVGGGAMTYTAGLKDTIQNTIQSWFGDVDWERVGSIFVDGLKVAFGWAGGAIGTVLKTAIEIATPIAEWLSSDSVVTAVQGIGRTIGVALGTGIRAFLGLDTTSQETANATEAMLNRAARALGEVAIRTGFGLGTNLIAGLTGSLLGIDPAEIIAANEVSKLGYEFANPFIAGLGAKLGSKEAAASLAAALTSVADNPELAADVRAAASRRAEDLMKQFALSAEDLAKTVRIPEVTLPPAVLPGLDAETAQLQLNAFLMQDTAMKAATLSSVDKSGAQTVIDDFKKQEIRMGVPKLPAVDTSAAMTSINIFVAMAQARLSSLIARVNAGLPGPIGGPQQGTGQSVGPQPRFGTTGAPGQTMGSGVSIGAININASTERGGRAAARGFLDELQSRGFLGAR